MIPCALSGELTQGELLLPSTLNLHAYGRFDIAFCYLNDKYDHLDPTSKNPKEKTGRRSFYCLTTFGFPSSPIKLSS